jgi:hypothetical protein
MAEITDAGISCKLPKTWICERLEVSIWWYHAIITVLTTSGVPFQRSPIPPIVLPRIWLFCLCGGMVAHWPECLFLQW